MKLPTAIVGGTLALALSGQSLAQGRDQISVVGSSTIYPFVTVAAERFGRDSEFRTPVVEQVGTGGGFKLFCAGLGVGTPDIATASRRITRTEFERCVANDVDQVVEIKLGFDGILIAGALEGPAYDFSLANLYLALAKDVPDPDGAQKLIANPYRSWAEVAPHTRS
ncbi:MAG: substrate-binding domain-containing protein [Pseudomonadota bacterium]